MHYVLLKKDALLPIKQEADNFIKYYQWKMKKENIVPFSREIAELISIQEKRVVTKFDENCDYLFPRRDGTTLKQESFREKLNKPSSYEEKIVDNKGGIFHFHSHAFRQTVSTKKYSF